jgi:hypothetical protein
VTDFAKSITKSADKKEHDHVIVYQDHQKNLRDPHFLLEVITDGEIRVDGYNRKTNNSLLRSGSAYHLGS